MGIEGFQVNGQNPKKTLLVGHRRVSAWYSGPGRIAEIGSNTIDERVKGGIEVVEKELEVATPTNRVEVSATGVVFRGREGYQLKPSQPRAWGSKLSEYTFADDKQDTSALVILHAVDHLSPERLDLALTVLSAAIYGITTEKAEMIRSGYQNTLDRKVDKVHIFQKEGPTMEEVLGECYTILGLHQGRDGIRLVRMENLPLRFDKYIQEVLADRIVTPDEQVATLEFVRKSILTDEVQENPSLILRYAEILKDHMLTAFPAKREQNRTSAFYNDLIVKTSDRELEIREIADTRYRLASELEDEVKRALEIMDSLFTHGMKNELKQVAETEDLEKALILIYQAQRKLPSDQETRVFLLKQYLLAQGDKRVVSKNMLVDQVTRHSHVLTARAETLCGVAKRYSEGTATEEDRKNSKELGYRSLEEACKDVEPARKKAHDSLLPVIEEDLDRFAKVREYVMAFNGFEFSGKLTYERLQEILNFKQRMSDLEEPGLFEELVLRPLKDERKRYVNPATKQLEEFLTSNAPRGVLTDEYSREFILAALNEVKPNEFAGKEIQVKLGAPFTCLGLPQQQAIIYDLIERFDQVANLAEEDLRGEDGSLKRSAVYDDYAKGKFGLGTVLTVYNNGQIVINSKGHAEANRIGIAYEIMRRTLLGDNMCQFEVSLIE